MTDPIGTMRAGFTGGMYPPPDNIPFDQRAAWQLDRSAKLGATCLQISDMPQAPEARQALRVGAEAAGIEIEGLARALFVPLGADPAGRVEELAHQLDYASQIGMTVVRHGWGRLTPQTSRFSPNGDVDAQKAHIVRCLQTAAPLAEAAKIPIAVENHCDFGAEELADMLSQVDSEWIGCALDTANSFTVFRDPNQEIPILAPLTLTTHIKDMRMIRNPLSWAIPQIPVGCRLGEGQVDLPRTIELLAAHSPKATGLHLIVEAGWEPEGCPEQVLPPLELRREILESGVAWLNQFIATH
ncbi:MAG: sugar phosphate isomerase/epimerase [Bifidobacteriaceae bacterium]|jgi:sugar phosphate isomerase/epimerase|nr:sugar phosphate isomerase/epimerase [Bifidobacteriaceae bacterium]